VKHWPQLRAGLIAVALFFGLVEGCPLPRPDRTPDWSRGFVEPIRDAQQFVLTPVAWIRTTLRVSQRWSLYQSPGRDRYRLWIEGQDADFSWRILFRASDPDHAEDEAMLDYTRPRGAWDPPGRMPPQYNLFARWVTRYFLAKHPELIATRVRLEHVDIVGDRVIPTGRFVNTFAHARGMR
jgi:hypothetical protein